MSAAPAEDPADDWPDEELDFSKITLEKLRSILSREGPYYPVVEGSNNPYRDGYVKEPPKKPRASYLFFQCTMRSYFQKKNPGAPQSELMTQLGEAWRGMSDEEREPYVQLANEEARQYEKERLLLEKAQRPNEVWQPMRRCREVLERLAKDSFADIFQEPVDLEEFPDYEEFIDSPMDLRTVREKLEHKKYQAPEQFARDMRRVRHFVDSGLSADTNSHCLSTFLRSGTIARSIISMDPLSGMSLTICRSNLSDSTMLGYWSSANVTSDGLTLAPALGNTLAGSTTASAVRQMIKWFCAITAMPCMASNVSSRRSRKFRAKLGTVQTASRR